MSTFLAFIQDLGWLLLIAGAIMLVAVGVDWVIQRILHGHNVTGLEDVYRRDAAMASLSTFANTRPLTAMDATDLCRACWRPFLPENSAGGICADCWVEAERREAERHHAADCVFCQAGEGSIHQYEPPVDDDEWQALWRVVDDERLDEEDHR